MKPIDFPEANSTLGGGPGKKWGLEKGNVVDLPVFRGEGRIISCWQPSWGERLSILFSGKVWLTVLAARTHAPVAILGASKLFEHHQTAGPAIEVAAGHQ